MLNLLSNISVMYNISAFDFAYMKILVMTYHDEIGMI